MSLSEEQKKTRGEQMQAGRLAKQQERAEKETRIEKLLAEQAVQIQELRATISDKNIAATTEFVQTGQLDKTSQAEIDLLRQELADLKIVLSNSGSLPKKVSTEPWKSTKRPFHRDIFRTKKIHKGFEALFIPEEELDAYKARGYTIARGLDYGEKEQGVLKARRMIGVERPKAIADEDRAILRDFNKAQRTSTLQKTKEMSERIRKVSGRKTELVSNL